MKKVEDADYFEKIHRALLIIEVLAMEECTQEKSAYNTIYEIAHRINGYCNAGCCKDLSFINDLEKSLKESNIIDVEKYL